MTRDANAAAPVVVRIIVRFFPLPMYVCTIVY